MHGLQKKYDSLMAVQLLTFDALVGCSNHPNWDKLRFMVNNNFKARITCLTCFFSSQDENSENKKDQQQAKAKAWEAEMKRKCKPIKPVTVGCLWLEEASLNLTLKRFAACLLVDGPIHVESSSTSSRNNEAFTVDSPNTSTSGALYVPDEGNCVPINRSLYSNKSLGILKQTWCPWGSITLKRVLVNLSGISCIL